MGPSCPTEPSADGDPAIYRPLPRSPGRPPGFRTSALKGLNEETEQPLWPWRQYPHLDRDSLPALSRSSPPSHDTFVVSTGPLVRFRTWGPTSLPRSKAGELYTPQFPFRLAHSSSSLRACWNNGCYRKPAGLARRCGKLTLATRNVPTVSDKGRSPSWGPGTQGVRASTPPYWGPSSLELLRSWGIRSQIPLPSP